MAEPTTHTHPRNQSNILSHWFFCWELPIFYKGYKKQLTEDDLYGPLKDHKSDVLGDKLEDAWVNETKRNEDPSLWRALKDVFQSEFLMYSIILVPIELGTRLCQPILIGKLMSYYTPNQTQISKIEAVIYSVAIILASFVYVVMGHSYALGLQHLGVKIRVGVSSLIHRKSLKLSQKALAEKTTGHVVNLLSNDVGRFDYGVLNLNFLWMAPLEILIILGILYWMLGATAIIGIVILLSFVPFQMYLSKKISEYIMRASVKTDKRVHLMSEIIGGIKIIKMYTWERPFAKLVERARKLEMDRIKTYSYLRGFSKSCPIYLARSAVFSCILLYVLTGGTLTPEYVYVVASFYETIRLSFVIFLPDAMRNLGELITSVKRIRKFLILDEFSADTEEREYIIRECGDIVLEYATNNIISDISLKVNPSQFVAIVGRVGSGKTTILKTILKEIPLAKGNVNVGGIVSYASQEPWLFSGTIRENIIFSNEFNRAKYLEVVRACALEHDFSVLPSGDQTLVGERGVFLSGGQKARINLARAVYHDADYYLLDDPLSSVDARVGKQIFENCIKGYLKNKGRLLVTHQLQYLGASDTIYLIESGRIVKSGSFHDLKESDNDFLNEEKPTNDKKNDKFVENEKKPLENKESQQDGVVSNTIYRDYFRAGGNILACTIVLLLHAIVQIIANGSDYFLSFWITLEQDNFKNQTLNTQSSLYIYSSLIVILILVTNLCSLRFFEFCAKTSTNLHNQMFSKIVHSPMRFFNTNPSGRILNRFSKDLGLIDQSLSFSLSDTIEISFTVIAIATVISIINPWILIPTILMFALFYFYRIIFLASSRNLKRIEGRTRSPIYHHTSTTLEGLVTIRALEAEKKLQKDFDTFQDVHSSAFYLFIACDGAFGFWLDLTCIIYLGIVTLSFLFIGSEYHGAGVGLSITNSIMMTGLLQWGMKQSGELENQMTSVERVLEYCKQEPELDDGTEIVPQSWPTEGRIKFSSVSLRYSLEDATILKNLNFVIKPKEKIGIVGRTGAGKSSLVSVLFRLAHIEGDVFIDGINTKNIPLENLRSTISIIPQEPTLFSETIRYNLTPFDEYPDSELWIALEEVEVKNYISELPGGLASKVCEGGSNFSVGQRQLLCLARAILRSNKILILDEATANVDPETDALIQRTIRRKFRDCTVLTIAHRLNTVMDSDRILVMDDGRVVEFDSPEKLMENRVFF